MLVKTGGKEAGLMGCKKRALRRVLALFLLMGLSVLVWSIFIGALWEKEFKETDSAARKLIAERVKRLELTANEREVSFDEEHDLNYVSRRRIPTGPDPIHNRRVVRLRVPPARH